MAGGSFFQMLSVIDEGLITIALQYAIQFMSGRALLFKLAGYFEHDGGLLRFEELLTPLKGGEFVPFHIAFDEADSRRNVLKHGVH